MAAASKNSAQLTREIYGDTVVHTPWLRPGFELGLEMQRICREFPDARGIVMGQHGLINWADDDRECYELTLSLIEQAASYIEAKYEANGGHATAFSGERYPSLDEASRRKILAEILPWLRGQVSQQQRMIGTLQDDEAIRRFVNSNDATRLAELGTSCPDHFLRTKIKPLYVPWDPSTRDMARCP